MEYRRSEIRAGVFLLAAFAIFVVMVFAMSDIQSLFKPKKDLTVLFSLSDGIEKNAQVRFSGIKIGKVSKIRVAPEYDDKIELTLSVFSDTVIKQDTRAAIKTLGLVGGKYVELTGGSPQAGQLGPGAVIHGEESFKMEELTKKGMEVADKLRNIAGNLDRTLGDPAFSKSIKSTLQNVQDITANIKEITSNREAVAQTLQNLPELLKKLEASTANLKDITDKADKLMGENRKNIDATMENVKDISSNLKEFTDEIKKHPWKLIRKP